MIAAIGTRVLTNALQASLGYLSAHLGYSYHLGYSSATARLQPGYRGRGSCSRSCGSTSRPRSPEGPALCRSPCLPPGVHVHGRLEVPRGAHGLSGRARRCGGRTKAEGGGGRRRPAGGGPLAAGGWRPALHSPPLPPSLYATTRRWSVSLDGIVCLARFLFDGAAVRAKSLTLYCRVSMCAREGWYMCNVAGHLAGRAACTRCGGCGR